MSDPLHARTLRLLEPWPAAMREFIHDVPGEPDVACFGPGDHGHWAVQTNATAAAALCVLASDPCTDSARTGMSRDEMMSLAQRLVRFCLRSHHAGGGRASDGGSWGHSWISALALERMTHGVEALGEALPESDRETLSRVLISESDWLTDSHEVTAGLVEQNHPESNLWAGCILHRTALRYPDTSRAEAYREQGTRFLLNGISTSTDAHSDRRIAGRPLCEWHVGANMFDSMACNHHGYLNVGYMVICLSNIAMLHFSCRHHGWEAPEALTHHARELWRVVKTCTFPDGRLWRIGGDTRVRYCYCQDYALPTWWWARDALGDTDTRGFEEGWLNQVEKEVAHNGDGRFLSARLEPLRRISPLYYARLEGDRAATLSMGALWGRRVGSATDASGSESIPVLEHWSDAYHGAVLQRGPGRMTSWTWRAAEPPQALCLPPSHSDMAEWRGNLHPRILGCGLNQVPVAETPAAPAKAEGGCSGLSQESVAETSAAPAEAEAGGSGGTQVPAPVTFPGGFAVCARYGVRSETFIAEGQPPHEVARVEAAVVALPDDQTTVVFQRATTPHRVDLREVKGLFLQIPNDVFNGMRRRYRSAVDTLELKGCPGREERHRIEGKWLSVDDALSVVRVSGAPLEIFRSAERNVLMRKPHDAEVAGGSLYVDELCCGCETEVRSYEAKERLLDLSAVILTSVTAEETEARVAERFATALRPVSPEVRGLSVVGADGRRYEVRVHFGDGEVEEPVPEGAEVLAGPYPDGKTVTLSSGGVSVLVV